jgi:hypothetical protein
MSKESKNEPAEKIRHLDKLTTTSGDRHLYASVEIFTDTPLPELEHEILLASWECHW